MDYSKKVKRLEKKLDTAWSLYIRSRDFWTCMRCHQNLRYEPQKLQGAHIIPKGASKYLRWNPDNGVALCYSCHIGWQHLGGNEVEFTLLAERVRSRKVLDELIELKRQNPTVRFGLKELEAKLAHLETLLKTVVDRSI